MSWCCRPCRCGTVVHVDDGREPTNTCPHGDAICSACSPGTCEDCLNDLQQPMSLGDCIAELAPKAPRLQDLLAEVLKNPDPFGNGHTAETPDDVFTAKDTTIDPLYVQRRRRGTDCGGAA